MITITGYKQFNYADFQKSLHKHIDESGKAEIKIAAEINVKSPATVQNALNTQKQMVSDKVLTQVMKAANLNGFILWENGKRLYFISTNGN